MWGTLSPRFRTVIITSRSVKLNLPLRRACAVKRRDVAQPGRALAWGARGRQFKSARPDHLLLEILRCAQDFACGLPSLRASRRLKFKSARPDHLLLEILRCP